MKTQVIILQPTQLSPAQKQSMWAIYQQIYNYTEENFMVRITSHTHISLYLHAGEIIGFTGLRINRVQIEGRRHLLLYFGQTVILHAFRGQSLIQTTALKLVLKYWKDWVLHEVWFWYDALSYKAYLASAKCAQEVYPSHRCPITEKVKRVRDFAGKTWYGDTYCPQSGTVAKQINVLNDNATHIYQEDLSNPDVAFYAQANPKYAEGHGLLTIVPVSTANISVMIWRFWNRLWSKHMSHSQEAMIPEKHSVHYS